MGVLHLAAGVTYAVAIMVFVDGALTSSWSDGNAFVFVDTLPLLLPIFGTVLLAMVNFRAILGDAASDEGMGGYAALGESDEGAATRARVAFFAGVFVQLAGFAVGVWRCIKYKEHPWGGVAQLLCAIAQMVAAAMLLYGQVDRPASADA
jgi:hypothetical protein